MWCFGAHPRRKRYLCYRGRHFFFRHYSVLAEVPLTAPAKVPLHQTRLRDVWRRRLNAASASKGRKNNVERSTTVIVKWAGIPPHNDGPPTLEGVISLLMLSIAFAGRFVALPVLAGTRLFWHCRQNNAVDSKPSPIKRTRQILLRRNSPRLYSCSHNFFFERNTSN